MTATGFAPEEAFMLWEQQIRYAVLSDVGFRRQNNQDACVVQLSPDQATWQQRGHLFVVADGMGGHAVGELASKIAVDTIPLTFDKLRHLSQGEALKASVEAANAAIFDRAAQNADFHRMGTTCSTLLLCPQGALVGHVGDSRVYRVRHRQIDQLSCDHSLVWELIEQRKVHPRDAERLCPRNVITRSLGPDATVEVDLEGPTPVLPGDVFVLCSDGLCGLLSDSEIGMIAGELPPTDATRLLVNLANLRGGPDNITVIVARAGDVPADAVENDDEDVAAGTSTAGWWAFALCCVLAAMFLVGLGLFILDPQQTAGGIGLIVASGLIAAACLIVQRLKRPALEVPRPRDPLSTIAWRPYRTAPARVTEEFLQRLARMEAELQKAAVDEGWAIEWKQYEAAFRLADDAMQRRRFAKALCEYGRVFDLLMVGVHMQRKQLQHDSRWGKGSNPTMKTKP